MISQVTDHFSGNTTIGYSSINAQGQLKIVSLMDLLQDFASEHAHLLGLSGLDLARKNLAWVIARYQISIIKSPCWLDNLTLTTTRIPFKNIYEIRYFTLSYPDGNVAIKAKSAWVMVNRSTAKPVRLSRFIPDSLLKDREVDETLFFKDLQSPETIDMELPFRIRMHDLDLNRHVNNAIYVEWAVETVPETVPLAMIPESIHVSFHKESFYGNAILSRTQILNNENKINTRHSILLKDHPVELARINIQWKPFDQ